MILSDLLKNIAFHIRSLFQEKRCILCTRPFMPRTPNLKNNTSSNNSQDFANTQSIFQTLEKLSDTHIHSHLCERCSQYNFLDVHKSNKDSNMLQENTNTILHIQGQNQQDKPYNNITIIRQAYCKLCGEIFYHDKNNFTKQGLCAHCSQTKPPWSRFYFINTYENSLRKLILNAKFHNSTTALSFLGKLLAYTWTIKLIEESIESEISHAQKSPAHNLISLPNMMIPMPLHTTRLKERGYNQCILLAQYFQKECNLLFKKFNFDKEIPSLDTSSLKRSHYTQAQSELNQQERKENVKNIFQVQNMNTIKNKHILLFDDIATTNSTLKEASRALIKAGAQRIDILILAKTPH